MLERIESFIREHGLIEPGGEVTCLVSGGADSTCLWHALGELGYRVSALARRARAARRRVRRGRALLPRGLRRRGRRGAPAATEAELRDLRYSFATDRLRATGHTASDQVESVLLGLVASGSPQRIKARREDGVVRPLLGVWREEVRAWCDERGLRVPRGLVESRHEARSDPRRDPAAAGAARPARPRLAALARGRAPAASPGARAHARRAARRP